MLFNEIKGYLLQFKCYSIQFNAIKFNVIQYSVIKLN